MIASSRVLVSWFGNGADCKGVKTGRDFGEQQLTPNDFHSLNELEQRLLAFQRRYEETASPFQWTFTRKDLATLLAKIENKRFTRAA